MTSIGADWGGTWLRVCVARRSDGTLRRSREPAPAFDELPGRLRASAPAADRLVIGCKGVWSARRRREAAEALAGLAKTVLVLSDVELARASAFAGGPGILVVGGTGSISYGLDGRGRAGRAGGLGPFLGDEGSAFWVGREALRDERLRAGLPADPLKLVHSADPVRAIAGLAPEVFRLARRRPGFARIRRRAAEELARLAFLARRPLSFGASAGPRSRAAPVSWHGGLFSDRPFLDGFIRALGRRGGFEPRPPLLAAEVAAAILPLALLGPRTPCRFC
ncbi:MAG: hypothetical protein HY927_03095 [Elusimicrobia bacterium]|nr:hypothetical protein [Elusimicrobiota bacterium]